MGSRLWDSARGWALPTCQSRRSERPYTCPLSINSFLRQRSVEHFLGVRQGALHGCVILIGT